MRTANFEAFGSRLEIASANAGVFKVGDKYQSDFDQESVTVRPKRLVQAPDYYRHPPGSF